MAGQRALWEFLERHLIQPGGGQRGLPGGVDTKAEPERICRNWPNKEGEQGHFKEWEDSHSSSTSLKLNWEIEYKGLSRSW